MKSARFLVVLALLARTLTCGQANPVSFINQRFTCWSGILQAECTLAWHAAQSVIEFCSASSPDWLRKRRWWTSRLDIEPHACHLQPFTSRILDASDEENRALLEVIFTHSTTARFVYRHRWQQHDLVFWDNRCTIHLAHGCPPQFRRHMHRTTVKGDKPY